METYTKTLLHQLEEKLQAIHAQEQPERLQAENCLLAVQTALQQLKNYISGYQFTSIQEEIRFFREVKPRFSSLYVFYNKLLWMEIHRPFHNRQAVMDFYSRQLERFCAFYEGNEEFCRYYHNGYSYLDEKYFRRQQIDPALDIGSFAFESDDRFTASHDHKVAKILAYEKLIQYINKHLGEPEPEPVATEMPGTTLKWTESKMAMIEMIYALFAKSAFNNGEADIKEIAHCFENMFQVSLGDYYRGFLDIRLRKTGKAKFLDALKESLMRKMDDAEERVFR